MVIFFYKQPKNIETCFFLEDYIDMNKYKYKFCFCTTIISHETTILLKYGNMGGIMKIAYFLKENCTYSWENNVSPCL